jgi:hypothetical protein
MTDKHSMIHYPKQPGANHETMFMNPSLYI